MAGRGRVRMGQRAAGRSLDALTDHVSPFQLARLRALADLIEGEGVAPTESGSTGRSPLPRQKATTPSG